MLKRAPRFGLAGFMALVLTLACAQGALAVGPYSHLRFARELWPQAAPVMGLDPQRSDLLPALFAGALAPDSPYYPGAEDRLATLVHVVKPWDFCRALLQMAQTPQDKAFALGWVSHALLDVLTHGQLVNRLAKGVYNHDRLLHKRIEWGLECRLLVQPENAWLWNPPVDVRAGLALWARALQKVYGGMVPESMLLQAQEAQMKEVRRLPYVWWWSGRLERQGHGLVNALGWAIGGTLRPAYVAWLTWRDQDLDVRAVLNPRRADAQDTRDLLALMQQEKAHLLKVLAGGAWPTIGLDADPSCHDEACPDGRRALEWLRKPGPKAAPADKIN
jgi:hypothetical protein